MDHFFPSVMKKKKIRITKPEIQGDEDEMLWEEINRYARLISEEPDPNLGRVREIKEEIQKGTYLTSEIVEGTASKLASRFLKKL